MMSLSSVMEESGGGGGAQAGDTPGKGSKLESLSREDLVKFVKKQTMVNAKTKAKCEGKFSGYCQ